MKKELVFIFCSFLLFYFSFGLFLPEAKGILFLSSYIANFFKYCFGDLAYLFVFLFLTNYLCLQKSLKLGIKYTINFYLIILLFAIFLSSFFSFGLISVLGSINFLLIILIVLSLLYVNYSFIYVFLANLKSKKGLNKVKKQEKKSNKAQSEKKTEPEILSDLGNVRFVKIQEEVSSNIKDLKEEAKKEIKEEIQENDKFKDINFVNNSNKKTFEKEPKLDPLDLGDKNVFKPKEKDKKDEIKIVKNPIKMEEKEEENIQVNETSIEDDTEMDSLNAIDEIIVDESETQSFVPKSSKKIEILSELEENKAILSELELGNVEIPRDFKLPSLELLEESKVKEIVVNEDELDEKINELLAKLKHFKIDGDVIKTYWGPVVTTFEFKPAADVKLSRISGLADDLAMALKATSIRILAPIPGKDVVGIEIPNKESQIINIRTIFEDELFVKSKSKLTIALGKDIVGNTFITDLKKLPHLLIAGTTGSGKSVGINAMILSLLYKNTPRTLRLLMIDPKMLEFSMYADIPHLLAPIITRSEKATIALKNMVEEMERRYELMASVYTKNIESFNEKAPSLGLEPFAYIVIIIDELADLMMTSGKEVEVYISRLAQMARAAGIHLIVATQRPSVDVITGLIKANLPSRLSYKVSTQTDSKVILGTKGAECLLGRGDSLFTPPGTSSIVRLHAPYASEEEIIRVVEHLKAQEKVAYDESILQDSSITNHFINNSDDNVDELFNEAVKVMRESGKTSISYIQRQLSIGYNRAANIVEQCEKQGILSEPNAKGVRTLL